MRTSRLPLIAISLAAALAAAGCGGGNSQQGYSPTPQPMPQPTPPSGESFTTWSKASVFAKPAEGSPQVMDNLVFNFDGDDNPNAYADVLPPT